MWLIILYIVLLVLFISFYYGGMSAAPWVPSRKSDLDRVFKLVDKYYDVKKNGNFVELGFGDGRIVFEAANRGMKSTGYEISLMQFIYTFIKRLFAKKDIKDRTKLHLKSFWGVSLGEADIVYFFLMPKIYAKMQKKLKEELKPGTLVITYVWPFEDWEPLEVSVLDGHHKIYIYKV